jgi:hypothetical protein
MNLNLIIIRLKYSLTLKMRTHHQIADGRPSLREDAVKAAQTTDE